MLTYADVRITACQASERCRYTLGLNLLSLLVHTYIFCLLRASARCRNALYYLYWYKRTYSACLERLRAAGTRRSRASATSKYASTQFACFTGTKLVPELQERRGVVLPRHGTPLPYSIYLLYWYKHTHALTLGAAGTCRTRASAT
jgi:hypothetical protein